LAAREVGIGVVGTVGGPPFVGTGVVTGGAFVGTGVITGGAFVGTGVITGGAFVGTGVIGEVGAGPGAGPGPGPGPGAGPGAPFTSSANDEILPFPIDAVVEDDNGNDVNELFLRPIRETKTRIQEARR